MTGLGCAGDPAVSAVEGPESAGATLGTQTPGSAVHGPLQQRETAPGFPAAPDLGDHHGATGRFGEVRQPCRLHGWIRQWRRERACRKTIGHCWHSGGFIDWWCCECAGETDGMPGDWCRLCAEKRLTS